LKLTLRFLLIIYFMVCICSCAKNEKAYDNFCRGMYESSKQMQEMEQGNEPPPGKEIPTYDQYKREGQEKITDH